VRSEDPFDGLKTFFKSQRQVSCAMNWLRNVVAVGSKSAVGARGFEPVIPCAQGKPTNARGLVR